MAPWLCHAQWRFRGRQFFQQCTTSVFDRNNLNTKSNFSAFFRVKWLLEKAKFAFWLSLVWLFWFCGHFLACFGVFCLCSHFWFTRITSEGIRIRTDILGMRKKKMNQMRLYIKRNCTLIIRNLKICRSPVCRKDSLLWGPPCLYFLKWRKGWVLMQGMNEWIIFSNNKLQKRKQCFTTGMLHKLTNIVDTAEHKTYVLDVHLCTNCTIPINSLSDLSE